MLSGAITVYLLKTISKMWWGIKNELEEFLKLKNNSVMSVHRTYLFLKALDCPLVSYLKNVARFIPNSGREPTLRPYSFSTSAHMMMIFYNIC